jgi:hydroxyacylglutathione hydrolase
VLETPGHTLDPNVFLRADVPQVAANVGMSGKGAADVFGEIRERKNRS